MILAFLLTLPILLQTASFESHAVRIVTFGDSLTAPRAGVVTYSELLSRSLMEQGIAVEVINSGCPRRYKYESPRSFLPTMSSRDLPTW